MRAQDAMPSAIRQLQAAGVPDAPGDARRLLAHALEIEADRLTLALPEALPDRAAQRFAAALAARAARQPVAQITGQRLFWGRSFRVTPDVLDPRPDTETLIAAALDAPFARVLDLGTGSGIILLTLLAERPDATGIAADLSPAALGVAAENAARLGLGARATLVLSDWFGAIGGRFDLIVANPPYIAEAELASLSPEVREWEPRLALCPGPEGLEAIRIIAAGAPMHLVPGGRLMMEIGPAQGPATRAIFRQNGLQGVQTLCDLDGRDRVVTGHCGPEP